VNGPVTSRSRCGRDRVGATVVVRSTGQFGVVASWARYKTEPEATHSGLIADEVAKVMPEIVVRDEQKRLETVQYLALVPLLLRQWQAQQAKIERLEKQNAQLEQQPAVVHRLEVELAALRRLLAARHAALTSPASVNSR
jgi:hypothetical protein